jgi:hypothetical protein
MPFSAMPMFMTVHGRMDVPMPQQGFFLKAALTEKLFILVLFTRCFFERFQREN